MGKTPHRLVMEQIAEQVDGAIRYNKVGRQCVVKTVNGRTYWVDYYPSRKPPYILSAKEEGVWRSYQYTSKKAMVGAINNGRRVGRGG